MVDATTELWEIHDRMPAVLRPEDYDHWLHVPAEEAMTMLAKYPASLLVVGRPEEPWSSRRQAELPRLL